MSQRKNILLTGGRSPTALLLARELAAAGHRVFVAETTPLHVCRFSNAVTKAFTVPSPRFLSNDFIEAIEQIVHDEAIDLILPTYEEIIYLAEGADRLPAHCMTFIPSFATLNRLHNKWLFHNHLLATGLLAPEAYLVRSLDEIQTLPFTRPFAMKPCYSRASQQVVRIVPGEPLPEIDIEPYNPWIAQDWLHGRKLCSYTVAYEGKIRAHATYPIHYSVDGNSCLVFESIGDEKVQKWVENFVEKENFTGQIAFDFIETDEGDLYPIECNPRATSGLYLLERQNILERIFFPEIELTHPLLAKEGVSKQIAAGMLMYGWRTALKEQKLLSFFQTLMTARDVVFDLRDIKPFLFEPLVMLKYLSQSRKWKLKVFAAFTYDCDWNNESLQNLQLD